MSAVTADSAAPASPPQRAPAASFQDWTAVFAGALGALMATLDISITNSALPTIQGEIVASGTEGTWISTGYLVSEVVMIPLSAWLTRVFGLRTLLLSCVILFTAFSIVCAASHDLTSMIIGRVGQGFFGGALIPTAQTIVRLRLPPWQTPIGMSLFGMIVLQGPLIGPLIGGWLTDNASWQWCFLLNVPIGVGLVVLLLAGLPHVRPNWKEVAQADWLGIAGMTVGLSALTVVLEEGQRDRWFESPLITGLTVASVVGLIVMGIAQVTSRRPVIRLSLMFNLPYASVILLVTALGMAFYTVPFVMAQFLSGIAGYDAAQSGQVLFVSGIPAFIVLPVLPLLLGRANIKVLVLFGLSCFAASCFIDTGLTAQTGGGGFTVSQLLRGFGQMFCFMPLNQASVGVVSRQDTGDASGLYNMARNLGGSMGLAMIGVFIDRRVESHADAIIASVNANSTLVQSRVAAQAAGFAANSGDVALGQVQALKQLAGQIHAQALVITYGEAFWILGVAIIAIMPLVFLLRQPVLGGASEGGH